MLVHSILLYSKIKLTFVFCHFWNCTHFWIRLLQIPKYLSIKNHFLNNKKPSRLFRRCIQNVWTTALGGSRINTDWLLASYMIYTQSIYILAFLLDRSCSSIAPNNYTYLNKNNYLHNAFNLNCYYIIANYYICDISKYIGNLFSIRTIEVFT